MGIFKRALIEALRHLTKDEPDPREAKIQGLLDKLRAETARLQELTQRSRDAEASAQRRTAEEFVRTMEEQRRMRQAYQARYTWTDDFSYDPARNAFHPNPKPPPKPTNPNAWYHILGIPETRDPKVINQAFYAQAKTAHPDLGGSDAKMKLLNAAREIGLKRARENTP